MNLKIWLTILCFSSSCSSCWAKHDVERHVTKVLTAISYASAFHRDIESQKSGSLANQKKRYLDLVKKIGHDDTWTHLPFPSNLQEVWQADAMKVANGLKPEVNYQVTKSKQAALICPDRKTAKAVYDNVRMISWYRNEIDKSDVPADEEAGSRALATLIDEFLKHLASSLPRTKITTIGKLNQSNRQKIVLPDFVLWEILSTINRCFFYKQQLMPGAQQFEKADICLLEAMTKTAILYGAKPPNSPLTDIRAALNKDSKGWRKAAYLAIESWRKVEKGHITPEQNFVNIVLTPKPTVVKKRKPENKEGFPDNVTDIKEVGGRIFIKNDGKWQPWK